jgi:hypothetical protein
MAIARQSLHRWWMALATTLGSMLATADASTCEAMGKQKSRSEPAAMAVPDGPESSIPIARLRSGSTHRPHRRPQAVPKIVPSYDPDDDTTSDDPDEDDDETSKNLSDSENDDTDVPIIAWLEERAPCPVPHECAPVTWSAPPSSSLLTLQPLRC